MKNYERAHRTRGFAPRPCDGTITHPPNTTGKWRGRGAGGIERARTVERAGNNKAVGTNGHRRVDAEPAAAAIVVGSQHGNGSHKARREALIALPAPSPDLDELIDACRRGSPERRRVALGALAVLYARPVAQVLLALGAPPQDIPDLVNEFLGIVVPERVLPAIDGQRGSFNGLLMRVLRRYLADARRDQHRRAVHHEGYRTEVRAIIITRTRSTRSRQRGDDEDQDVDALHRALRNTRAYCLANNMLPHWRAFAMFHLMPLGPAAHRPGLAEIAEALNAFEAQRPRRREPPRITSGPAPATTAGTACISPQRAAVMIRSVRARLRLELRSISDNTTVAARRAVRACSSLVTPFLVLIGGGI